LNEVMMRLALLVLVLTASLSAQVPAGTVTVTGRVVAEATGQPVRQALVLVYDADSRVTRATSSDLEGRFSIAGLTSGRYRVGAMKRPLLSAVVDATGGDVVIALATGAVITGSVIDNSGRSAAGITLSLSGSGLPSPQMARTDLRGEYRFHSLPPGAYVVALVGRKGEARNVVVEQGRTQQAQALLVEPAEPAPAPRPPGAPPAPVEVPGNGIVGGQVLDAVSSRPLPGVAVIHSRSRRTVVSDGDGRFIFTGLGMATQSFQVQQPGYSPTSSVAVLLASDTPVTDLVLRAGRHGSIAGTVRDDGGDPIVGMSVRAFRKQVINFQPMLMPRGDVMTDDRGAFRIEDLPPGDYLLCACASDPVAIDPRLVRLIGPTGGDARTVGRLVTDTMPTFAPTYFPGVTRQVDSQIVMVGYQDDRAGMDITLYGAKSVTVTGLLLEMGGPPSQAMQIFLLHEGDLPGAMVVGEAGPVELLPDGRFRFVAVAPGAYSLHALPAGQATKPLWAHHRFSVVDRNIDGLQVTLGEGLSVSGRLDFSGLVSRPTAEVLAKARIGFAPLDMSTRQIIPMGIAGSVGHSATLNENGQFTVSGLAGGRYRVVLTMPESQARVQRLVAGDAAVIDDIVTIENSGTTDMLVVATDTPLATLDATVKLERYVPSNATRVVIFPTDPTQWIEPERYPQRFQSNFLSAELTARMTNVPPGEYFVAVVSIFDFEMSVRNLERWARTAKRATLRSGATTTISIER